MINPAMIDDLEIKTRFVPGTGWETIIRYGSLGMIAYGKGTKQESEDIALNSLHEQRRRVLLAIASGLNAYLTTADICKRTGYPTAVVQYHLRKLIENQRVIEHIEGGRYKARGE